MKKLKISLVLPFPVTKPVGGASVMYQYANLLQSRGHVVSVFHSLKRPYKKSKTPLWYKQFIFWMRKAARPKWFALYPQVKCFIVPAIIDKYMPDADIVMSTWWQMAYAVNELSNAKGKKFNLVQDYETWNSDTTLLHQSYSLPVHHIVIAQYLQDLLMSYSGIQPVHIPNAIDTDRFSVQVLPQNRNTQSVIMLYSREKRKGTPYAMEAFHTLKKDFPDMLVTLFGVYPPPADLPVWIKYFQKPGDLPSLYNQSAIFLSPSLGEGWALPPAEAMACGCAVVCTQIGGHRDYAISNETAILVSPEKPAEIYDALKKLFTQPGLRIQMANRGREFMASHFSWEKSVSQLESCFYTALSE